MATFPSKMFSVNVLTIFPNVDFMIGSQPLPQLSVTATATVNDTLVFPAAPAGDIYQVTASYDASTLGGEPGTFALIAAQIGPGSPSHPEIMLTTSPCPPGGCVFSASLPANAFSFLAIQGSAELVANSTTYPFSSVSFGGPFTFSRFKSDGVTPDPFVLTPEPSSSLLLGLGTLFLAALVLRRSPLSSPARKSLPLLPRSAP